MGFDTIIAAIVTLALILAVAYVFASSSFSLMELSTVEYKKAVHKAMEILSTRIDITNITYYSTTVPPKVVADIKNCGETRFDNFSYFDVFLYGNASGYTGTYYPTIAGTNFYLVNEITNPGIFDPHETARVEVLLDTSLPNGTYVLVVCTPNGVCSSGEFSVGG